MAKKKLDYIYIRAWESMMGAFPYYIDNQLDKAREEKAPANAIYKRHDGVWRTFDDIENPETKSTVARIVEQRYGGGQ